MSPPHRVPPPPPSVLCRQIFAEDNYTPIVAETEEQYHKVLNLFPYHNKNSDSAPYPRHFPFSQMVEKVYCKLQAFVRNCSDYAEGLNLRCGS